MTYVTDSLANIWVRKKIDEGIKNWGVEFIDFGKAQVSRTFMVLDDVEGCCSFYEIVRRVKPEELRFVFSYVGASDMSRELHDVGDDY